MRDIDLYRHLLGLEQPWKVTEVKLSVTEHRVDVWAGHAKGTRWPCPECGQMLATYDHTAERSWRHLDSCQFETHLHARTPRVNCGEHGVRQVKLPWAEDHARFTALFERLAIDVLMETNVSGAMRILRISWDEAWHILQRAVARGMRRKKATVITHLGIDEKAIAKGHKYMTLVYDIKRSVVDFVVEDRKQGSLDGYFATRTPEQLKGIEAMAMDMWDPFVASALAHVPGAADKIVFDKFHIMKHMTQAVDTVRKREHREMLLRKKDTLTKTKYLWLYSEENLPEKHQERFEDLKALNLKTARAWAIKESLRGLWGYTSRGWAMKFWKSWNYWATHSKLQPVKAVAAMLKRRLHNVLTYFAHRIDNAIGEGLNSKIQTVKKMAYGFRNRENFKTAIYFHCGGLNLYPATHTNPG